MFIILTAMLFTFHSWYSVQLKSKKVCVLYLNFHNSSVFCIHGNCCCLYQMYYFLFLFSSSYFQFMSSFSSSSSTITYAFISCTLPQAVTNQVLCPCYISTFILAKGIFQYFVDHLFSTHRKSHMYTEQHKTEKDGNPAIPRASLQSIVHRTEVLY